MDDGSGNNILVIGAGPAGLAAGYSLVQKGFKPVVLEKRDIVGGISCTESFKGFLFDMGGHRFFSKDKMINDIWKELLKDDFLLRNRLSRIYYKKKFFDYPLRPWNALKGMGIFGAFSVAASYFRWRVFPYRKEHNFERWVTNRFGKRLYNTFFKSYTEKVWGIPCSEIRSEWAAQRIKDLSLKKMLAKMLLISDKHYVSLIEKFLYPRRGPSMMWNAIKDFIDNAGGSVRMQHDVRAIVRDGFRVRGIQVENDGKNELLSADHYISSMPITSLVKRLDPAPPPDVVRAAENLRWRDFITVCLIVDKPDLFPDQWIYVHDPGVRMGRMQNYRNWSPEMVPDPSKTGLGLEYFCTAGDELWCMPDEELMELGKNELSQMGLARRRDVIDGTVFRIPKAYPVYDSEYSEHLEIVRDFVGQLENFQTMGRSGLFRYNNMDHSMVSGISAVQNIVNDTCINLWSINEEEEYLEEQASNDT